jgi:hypothetical protein
MSTPNCSVSLSSARRRGSARKGGAGRRQPAAQSLEIAAAGAQQRGAAAVRLLQHGQQQLFPADRLARGRGQQRGALDDGGRLPAQRRPARTGIGRPDALPQRAFDPLRRQSLPRQRLLRLPAAAEQPEHDVLGADIAVRQPPRRLKGRDQRLLPAAGEALLQHVTASV